MRNQLTRAALAVCVLLVPLASEAQPVASSPDQLRALVKPGDKLIVTDLLGRPFRGTILDLTPTSLTLQANGQPRQLLMDEVQTIAQPRRGSIGKGAAIGAAVGAAFGFLMAEASGGLGSESGAYAYLLGIPIMTGIGAGAGAGFAAATVNPHVIYKRSAAPVTVTAAPLIGRSRQGLQVSLQF